MKKYKVSPEVKEQILNRIKNDGVTVADAAKEHGLDDSTIYYWIAKGTKGNPTVLEVAKLKKENESLLKLVGEITLKLSETQKKR